MQVSVSFFKKIIIFIIPQKFQKKSSLRGSIKKTYSSSPKGFKKQSSARFIIWVYLVYFSSSPDKDSQKIRNDSSVSTGECSHKVDCCLVASGWSCWCLFQLKVLRKNSLVWQKVGGFPTKIITPHINEVWISSDFFSWVRKIIPFKEFPQLLSINSKSRTNLERIKCLVACGFLLIFFCDRDPYTKHGLSESPHHWVVT